MVLAVVADMPPLQQERIVCSIAAAVKYEIPANILIAVAEQEGGKPGQWVRNTNGTHDVGVMQFNTSYLRTLEKKYGITAAHVGKAGCYPYFLAAWRLRGHIRNDRGDIWTRAANYHSRTPVYNQRYRASLIPRAIKWGKWLDARFVTIDVHGIVKRPAAPTPVKSVEQQAQQEKGGAQPSAVSAGHLTVREDRPVLQTDRRRKASKTLPADAYVPRQIFVR